MVENKDAFDYYEYKYLVPSEQLPVIKQYMYSKYVNTDPFGASVVSSVYYDHPQLRCYQECLDGARVKNKIRVRSYEGTDSQTLQVKRKNLSSVKKWRVGVTKQDLAGPRLFQTGDSAINFMANQYGPLQPVVDIRYLRHRFRFQNHRVTIDENIHFRKMPGAARMQREFGEVNFAVLEIKTRALEVRSDLFCILTTRQTSFSKYLVAMAYLLNQPEKISKHYY